jgi:hypothetical protein
MFSFITTAFSGLLSKVMLGSIAALGIFCTYQFIQNSRITNKLTVSESNFTKLDAKHKLLKDQYAGLETQLKQLQQSGKATSDILDEGTKTIITYKDRFDLVDQRVASKVNDIKKKYEDKERTIENKKAEEAEISSARINGLWASFCTSNTSSPKCTVK